MAGETERRRRFVEAYLGPAGGVAAEAARQAGFKCGTPQSAASTGERLMREVDIARAIAEGQAALRAEVKRATIADIVEQEELLTRILRGEEYDVAVERVDGEAQETAVVVPIEPRLRALDQLGKRHGAYAADKALGKQAAAAERVAMLLALAKGLKGE